MVLCVSGCGNSVWWCGGGGDVFVFVWGWGLNSGGGVVLCVCGMGSSVLVVMLCVSCWDSRGCGGVYVIF